MANFVSIDPKRVGTYQEAKFVFGSIPKGDERRTFLESQDSTNVAERLESFGSFIALYAGEADPEAESAIDQARSVMVLRTQRVKVDPKKRTIALNGGGVHGGLQDRSMTGAIEIPLSALIGKTVTEIGDYLTGDQGLIKILGLDNMRFAISPDGDERRLEEITDKIEAALKNAMREMAEEMGVGEKEDLLQLSDEILLSKMKEKIDAMDPELEETRFLKQKYESFIKVRAIFDGAVHSPTHARDWNFAINVFDPQEHPNVFLVEPMPFSKKMSVEELRNFAHEGEVKLQENMKTLQLALEARALAKQASDNGDHDLAKTHNDRADAFQDRIFAQHKPADNPHLTLEMMGNEVTPAVEGIKRWGKVTGPHVDPRFGGRDMAYDDCYPHEYFKKYWLPLIQEMKAVLKEGETIEGKLIELIAQVQAEVIRDLDPGDVYNIDIVGALLEQNAHKPDRFADLDKFDTEYGLQPGTWLKMHMVAQEAVLRAGMIPTHIYVPPEEKSGRITAFEWRAMASKADSRFVTEDGIGYRITATQFQEKSPQLNANSQPIVKEKGPWDRLVGRLKCSFDNVMGKLSSRTSPNPSKSTVDPSP